MDIIMDQEVKVPEGVTIDKPTLLAESDGPSVTDRNAGITQTVVGMNIPDFEVDPALPRILFPHYIDNSHKTLACTLLRPDGSASMETGIPKDPQHPLCADIFQQYTEDEIKHNTQREIQTTSKLSEAAADHQTEEKQQRKREDLWDAKQAYLALDQLKLPENKSLRREIRKSQTKLEADAYGMAAILRAYELKSN